MEKTNLKATVRNEFGKNACKHLRKEDMIPSVVYAGGKPGMSVQVNRNDLWHVLHTDAGENVIITMEISGGDKDETRTVIVREVQEDPINNKYIHVDFHEISLKDKLKVNVPVQVKGEAVGVKEEEGVLAQIEWELEVECLPTDIPEHITVHVDELKIGDAIHVKDLEAIPGVAILTDPEQVIVTVNAPQEEEPEEEEGAEGEEGEEPEVIKKGKKEEEGEEEEGGDTGENEEKTEE